MLPEETYNLATAYHLQLLDVRSVLLSRALLDEEKVQALRRHFDGSVLAGLKRDLQIGRRQYDRHRTRYAEAIAIAGQLHELLGRGARHARDGGKRRRRTSAGASKESNHEQD